MLIVMRYIVCTKSSLSNLNMHLSCIPSECTTSKVFRWDQAGYYDIPAMIDHVLNVTGHDSLQYVGLSMGTTGFMVAANEHPEFMSKKVKMAHLTAPVAYVAHMRSPIVVLLPVSNLIEVCVAL